MKQSAVEVLGVKELQEVFNQLPRSLGRGYMTRLVTKGAGKVRTRARRLAPDSRRTGTTALKSQSEKDRHQKLRKNIRSSKKFRRNKATGEVRKSVWGPPQTAALISGHAGVAWGRSTGRRVKPVTDFFEVALEAERGNYNRDAAALVKEWINKDAKRLGEKQKQGVKMSAASVKKLGRLRTAQGRLGTLQ